MNKINIFSSFNDVRTSFFRNKYQNLVFSKHGTVIEVNFVFL